MLYYLQPYNLFLALAITWQLDMSLYSNYIPNFYMRANSPPLTPHTPPSWALPPTEEQSQQLEPPYNPNAKMTNCNPINYPLWG